MNRSCSPILLSHLLPWAVFALSPAHYSALPRRFRSRGPSEFVKLFDREGLERRLPGEDRPRIIKNSVVSLTLEVAEVDV